ncbi:MAG: hypothetical protein HRF49_05850 [bacterium]
MSVPLRYRIRNWFLRILARLAIFLVCLVPERAAYAFARGVAALAGAVLAGHVRIGKANVALVLGTESGAERARIVRASLVNLAYTMIEFIRMGKYPGERVKEMIVEERGGGIAELRRLLEDGKGLIGLGMHLGNWELSGAYIALSGLPMYAVGKEQRDPYFTNLAFPWRERHGIVNIFSGAKLNPNIVRALKNNCVLGLLADQNGGKTGIFAPFCGIEASNVAGPAALHLKFGSPLVPIVAWRISPGKLVFEVGRPVETGDVLADAASPNPSLSHEERLREVTRRVNLAYEKLVREHPEQWLWIHKRFKTRPPGEPDVYARMAVGVR